MNSRFVCSLMHVWQPDIWHDDAYWKEYDSYEEVKDMEVSNTMSIAYLGFLLHLSEMLRKRIRHYVFFRLRFGARSAVAMSYVVSTLFFLIYLLMTSQNHPRINHRYLH